MQETSRAVGLLNALMLLLLDGTNFLEMWFCSLLPLNGDVKIG